ncbi:MAG: hypothetical protein R2865_16200 [Deinococcales bacterium]
MQSALAQLFYLPSSEWGKAIPNIPQSTSVPKPLAFMGDEPAYEPFKDFSNNPRYWKIGRSIGRLDLLIDSSRLGPVVSYCTATLISVDLIITNYHCIPGMDQRVP